MEWVTAPSTIGSSGSFVVDLVIAQNDRMPILAIDAIVERQAPDQNSKFGAGVVARSRCPMAQSMDCSASQLQTIAGSAAYVQRIKLVGVFSGSVVEANRVNTGYYTTGAFAGSSTGYGYDLGTGGPVGDGSPAYDSFDYGYGYGYKFGDGPKDIIISEGSGFGYGYSAGDLILRYEITVGSLPSGVHYLTVHAMTGLSAMFAELSSPYTQFQSIGGGGGSGGGGGGGGGGAGSSASVTGTQTTTSPGASATFQASSPAGQSVSTLTVDLPASSPIDGLTIQFDTAQTDVTVTVDVFTSAPPGLTMPPGTEGLVFFAITITGGTGNGGATFTIDVPLADLAGINPAQIIVIHTKPDGTTEFLTVTRGPDADGEAHFTITTTSLSPFALVVDTQGPQINVNIPTGTLSGVQAITVGATDNLQVAKIEAYVDGVLVQTIQGAAGVFNWNTASFSNGAHALEFRAYDLVSNREESTGTAQVQNEGAVDGTQGPGGETPGPKGGSNVLMWVGLFALLAVAVVVMAVVILRKKPKEPGPQ